jgi:trigger factor
MQPHETHSTVHPLSPVEVKIDIQVPWNHVQQHLDDSFQRIQRTAHVKGFRPGKAPAKIVQQVYGSSVRSDVLTTMIEEGLYQAIQTHSIQPLGDPRIDALPSFDQGKPLEFSVIVEVRPEIGALQLEGIEITISPVQVEESQVDAEIEQLRKRLAEQRTPEPARPSKQGDVLTVDYRITIEGKERPDLNANGVAITLNPGEGLLPGLLEGLYGKNIDETATISLVFPSDFGNEALRDKPAVFDVHVREIREVVLPEVDDDFAKDCGEYATLEELRTFIRTSKEQRAQREIDSEIRSQLIEKLTELNPIAVPPGLVHRQFLQLKNELQEFMRMLGRSLPDTGEDDERLRKEAEQKVRASLLFSEIAKREKLDVSDDELEQEIQSMAAKSGKHVAKIRAELGQEKEQWLRLNLIEAKVMAFLKSKSTITESARSTNAPTDP